MNNNPADLRINEVMAVNTKALYDENGQTPDWIEIINKSKHSIKLDNYYLSENPNKLMKWKLPDFKLGPGRTFIVYASDNNLLQTPLHYYTIIDAGQTWKYFVPKEEPDSKWKNLDFDDSSWKSGETGIGNTPENIKTFITKDAKSVFLRKFFIARDIKQLKSVWLHLNYDDGFVAYINGTEVCRSQMGTYGTKVQFSQSSLVHEAKLKDGEFAEGFDISDFIYLLKGKENMISIQVHNSEASGNGIIAIPYLTFGYNHEIETNSSPSGNINIPVLYPHSNFKLSSLGEKVILTYKNARIIDSVNYGKLPANISFGRNIDSPDEWGYFAQATPGYENETPIFHEIVKNIPEFSVREMFLKSHRNLSISGAGKNEKIYYTLDGSEPALSDLQYEKPINLAENVIVRARIFGTDAVPGEIVSKTYLFDKPPLLPVISIITESENLWDFEKGIYVLGSTYENENPYYGANYWQNWEKPAFIEMATGFTEPVFSMNCGIKIFGGKSQSKEQKSFSIFFKKEYGDGTLEDIRLFRSKPIKSFHSIVLRNCGNDYDGTRFRDGFITDLVKNLDIDIAAFEPVVLYLNGNYWGHINLREKINEDYLESNHGVDADKIDLLEYTSRKIVWKQ